LTRWSVRRCNDNGGAPGALSHRAEQVRHGRGMDLAAALFLGLAGTTAMAGTVSGPASKVQEIREPLEQQFRDVTGLGFDRFDCDPLPTPTERWELTCEAVDEEGDRFIYRIVSDGSGEAPSVSMSQPVTQLNPAGLERIAKPCEAFIDAFDERDWQVIHAQLEADFQASFPVERVEAILLPLRNEFGHIGSKRAVRYGSPQRGVHQLEFSIVTDHGEAAGRFRLAFVDDENVRIIGFLLTAQPGSELQAHLLAQQGAAAIRPFLDQSVVSLEGPFSDLRRIGDAAELSASLESGATIAVRVEQTGTTHDLDANDYVFQILDAPTLVRHQLTSSGFSPQEVDCPVRVVPDGGETGCTATLSDSSTRRFTLARRGGEHWLREIE
jgi:hypothetical protein